MYRNLLGLYFLLPSETIHKTLLQAHKPMVVWMLRYIEREGWSLCMCVPTPRSILTEMYLSLSITVHLFDHHLRVYVSALRLSPVRHGALHAKKSLTDKHKTKEYALQFFLMWWPCLDLTRHLTIPCCRCCPSLHEYHRWYWSPLLDLLFCNMVLFGKSCYLPVLGGTRYSRDGL